VSALDTKRTRERTDPPSALTPRRVRGFWAMVDKSAGPDGCWTWTGTLNRGGYATAHFGGRYERKVTARAHRVAWLLEHGAWPPADMFVCHRCDVRHCVNPAHLFLGTNQDNMDDMNAKGRGWLGRRLTHCRRGHDLTAENRMRRSDGKEQCRVCHQASQRASTQRKAARRIAARAATQTGATR